MPNPAHYVVDITEEQKLLLDKIITKKEVFISRADFEKPFMPKQVKVNLENDSIKPTY